MNNNNDILKILAQLSTVQNLRVSKIDKQKALILNCFLLLLKKNLIISKNQYLDSISGHKETIDYLIIKHGDTNIKWLYDEFLKRIITETDIKYLGDIIDVFLPLKTDFLNRSAGQLVDAILSGYFNRFSGSTSMQPKELSTIMNHFLSGKKYKSYYNPFSGLSSLATNLPEDINYFGEEIVEPVWLLSQLRVLIHNPKLNFKIGQNDCIYNSVSNLHYDFIAFNPPFKLRLEKNKLTNYNSNSEYFATNDASAFIISENFKKLNKNGRMVFVIPSGFLHSNRKSERALKKFLIENNYIESIIALPQRILSFTGIEVNIVVLTKNASKLESVKFIDATESFKRDSNKMNSIDSETVISLIKSSQENDLVKYIPNQVVKENDYSLAVNRYVFEPLDLTLEQQNNLVKLKDIVSILRSSRSNEKEGIFIRVSDLSDKETTDYSKTFQEVLPRALRSDARLLENNNILLSLIGNRLKPTLFKVSNKPVYYPQGHMIAAQVNEELVDVDYLILELRKDYVQKQIKQKSRGAGMPRISRNELMQIQLVLPTLEEQHRKKYSYQESIIDEQKEKLQTLINEFGIDVADENSFLRHKISGTLRNMRGSFSKLKQIVEEQVVKDLPELYTFKANPKLPATFLDYLNRIERDLKAMHNSVQAVGKELNLQEIQLQPIHLLSYMKDYVDDIKNRAVKNFSINVNLDLEQLKTENIKDIIIQGDKETLHQIFDNIIENAEKHAFTNNQISENKIEIELLYDFEEQEVQIDFTNTGHPLPENYSFEEFTRRGSKSGINAGSGLGGWFVYQVMKRHNGRFGFTDETGPEGIKGDYATTIELTFPIQVKF